VFRQLIRKFRRRGTGEINPDEIFIDSSNLPKFDVDQFEGRLETPISKKTFIIISVLFLAIGGVFISRFWFLQVNRGEAFAIRSEANRLRHIDIFANRGVIFDRNRVELAANEIYTEEEKTNVDFAKRSYAPIRGVAHLIGYVKYPLKDSAGFYSRTSYVGQDGIEKTYDDVLSGENGNKIIETDARGEVQSQGTVKPPRDGQSITLTIDSRLNDKLYEIMEKSSLDYGFSGGAAIMMDIENGDLLTLMSYPEFSSTVLTEGDRSAIAEYQKDSRKPFLNRAISGIYTPGSIVKPLMAIGALTEGLISPSKQILSTGSISIPNKYFPDKPTVFNDWKAHGWVDMREAIAVSSNVYFFEVGGGFEDQKGLGIANIEKYLRMFGLGEKTDINLIGESDSVIPNPEWKEKNFDGDPWRIGDTYNTSIGQYGLQFTPIQVVRYVAAIANNGTLLTPQLVKSEGDHEIEPEGEIKKISLSSDHFRVIKEGMRQAVTDSVAGSLNVPYVQVAAKTGTAELGTRKEFVNSWTVGFFPYESPKYAFAVLMERGPRSNLIGASYVLRQLLDWMNQNTPEYFQ
jgi:penicillin-binding protein 2